MILAGSHVAPDRQVQRGEAFRLGSTYRLDLGEAIEHPEVDVVGVGLGDLSDSLITVGNVGGDREPLQLDRWSGSHRILEGDDVGRLGRVWLIRH